MKEYVTANRTTMARFVAFIFILTGVLSLPEGVPTNELYTTQLTRGMSTP